MALWRDPWDELCPTAVRRLLGDACPPRQHDRYISLGSIVVVLFASIWASLRADRSDRDAGHLPPHDLPVTDATSSDEPGGVDPHR